MTLSAPEVVLTAVFVGLGEIAGEDNCETIVIGNVDEGTGRGTVAEGMIVVEL